MINSVAHFISKPFLLSRILVSSGLDMNFALVHQNSSGNPHIVLWGLGM